MSHLVNDMIMEDIADKIWRIVDGEIIEEVSE